MSDRLAGIRAKIERAKNHIRDLEARILAFREVKPYRLLCDYDSQTGQRIFRSRILAQPPIQISVIAGETIHQLRSSLDHLAWQLVEANGQAASKRTMFPISETEAIYKSESPRKVKGINSAAISLIDALKPYQSGNDPLWKLHELNNFDKHRLLFVVAYSLRQIEVSWTAPGLRSGSGQALLRQIMSGIPRPKPAAPTGGFPILQDGAEICRIVGGMTPQMDEQLDLAFEIAFWQPQVVQGEPVVPFLHQLANAVDSIVNQFIPFL